MTDIIHEIAVSNVKLTHRDTFYTRHGKRIFDLTFALALLPLLLPIIIILACLVKLDGGPAFFAHARIGMNGREFKCLKLRTMQPGAELCLKKYLAKNEMARAEWAASFKLRNDPRITKLGKILRKTSLDELPQIFNVFLGEMSFVGPRPVQEIELQKYGAGTASYQAGRPGITGEWQVGARNDIDYAERVATDITYRREERLLRDLILIVKTPLTIFNATGL